jgi:TnpA family transposase
LFEDEGGAESVFNTCQIVATHHGDNTLPLLWNHYASHHKTVFEVVDQLDLQTTSKDERLLKALHTLQQHKDADTLPPDTPIDFASQRWQRSIRERVETGTQINRRQFEVCVFTYLHNELKSGDIAVQGAEHYADYRQQLLSWDACQPMLDEYCQALGFASDPSQFVAQLKEGLTLAAEEADQHFPEQGQLTFEEDGRPTLKRIRKRPTPTGATALKRAIKKRMPQRTVLDALAFVEHWVNFTRHFGPLSGSDPKISDKLSRYIMTVFGYGCNLGPEQTARHSRGKFTARMLSHANRQHITAEKLEAAIRDIINYFNRFDLPKYWGTGQTAAADGTLFNTYLNNLMAERHIRYGEYGGVAYHHLSDTYIALFSHFITCGVWEATYILDGLLENTSDIQPDTLHADTQGQSLTVFGLSHLLGIRLMPRIRNWKDLTLHRPDKRVRYAHIDDLFTDTIDWDLIETHWQDLMRVVLSIRAGELLPSMLLRKLGNFSKKNRLYKAFRELGRVVRTIFLLRYVSDSELRRQITATTNKIETFHRFIEWIFFGGQGIIRINDPIEMEKRIKYNDLVASALIVLNVVDMTRILHELDPEEYIITRDTLATLSPYWTDHTLRFGDFVIDLDLVPELPILEPIPIDMSEADKEA